MPSGRWPQVACLECCELERLPSSSSKARTASLRPRAHADLRCGLELLLVLPRMEAQAISAPRACPVAPELSHSARRSCACCVRVLGARSGDALLRRVWPSAYDTQQLPGSPSAETSSGLSKLLPLISPASCDALLRLPHFACKRTSQAADALPSPSHSPWQITACPASTPSRSPARCPPSCASSWPTSDEAADAIVFAPSSSSSRSLLAFSASFPRVACAAALRHLCTCTLLSARSLACRAIEHAAPHRHPPCQFEVMH